jgi:hypothetical protein
MSNNKKTWNKYQNKYARNRYKNDPEYRERILQAQKKFYNTHIKNKK